MMDLELEIESLKIRIKDIENQLNKTSENNRRAGQIRAAGALRDSSGRLLKAKRHSITRKSPAQASTAGPAPLDKSPVTDIKYAFLESFKLEFGRMYPGWGVKENSQAKQWLRSVPIETAIRLCTLYPKWNDPWVTERGHTFGLLVAKYVELDAWAQSSDLLIEKIARGRAVRTNELKRAIEREDMRVGVEQRAKEIEGDNDSRANQRQLPSSGAGGISQIDDSPFEQSVFDSGDQDADGSSGRDSRSLPVDCAM